MKYLFLTLFVISTITACHTGRTKNHTRISDSILAQFDSLSQATISSNHQVQHNSDSVFAAINAIEETTDTLPDIGLRTDSIIYVADTTTEAIMKALYYTATGKGDSTQGIASKIDYPEDALVFSDRDTA